MSNPSIFKLGVFLVLAASISSCGVSREKSASALSLAQDVAPLLSIETPPVGTFITTANFETFTVTGFCGYEGGTVTLQTTFPVIGTSICSGGTWSIELDVSFVFDGVLTFTANIVGPLGETVPAVSRDFIKDTISPTGAMIKIGDGVTIPTSLNVALTLLAADATRMYITNTPGCASGGVDEPYATSRAWTLAPVGTTATVYAIFRDDAGNASNCVSATTQVNISAAPTVSIVTPAAGSLINSGNQASFAVSGLCSENGRQVVISGGASASVACTAGAWSASLNFTAAPQGTVTITANHSNSDGTPAVPSTRSFTKDTIGSNGTISINGGAASVVGTAVTLTLNSADAAQMYITNVAGCASGGVFEAYGTTKSWTLAQTSGTATVYVAFRDAAGNVGACVNDQITVTSPALVISPATLSISNGTASSVTFTATGGTPAYVFSIVSGAGSIVPATGAYSVAAGATGTTIVRVTDSAAKTADATITHTASCNMPKQCYNIQLIGMRPKCGDFSGDDRRSLFIPMDGKVKILLQEGPFKIIDANGTDGVAALSLPNPDPGNTGTLGYRVYTRLVGKPGTKIDMSKCKKDTYDNSTYCEHSTFGMTRMAGAPKFKDSSSDLLYSKRDGGHEGREDGDYLFSTVPGSFFWSAEVQGRAHLQMKFCVEPKKNYGGHDDDHHGGHGGHDRD